MMIDTHCHIHSDNFDSNRSIILDSLNQNNISVITVGTSISDSKKAIDLAKGNLGKVYASVGIHPQNTLASDYRTDILDDYISLARKKEVKALGEMGFDFYYSSKKQVYDIQKDFFCFQISVADELQKPIIVHTRESFQETFELLSEYQNLKVVLHCFTGNNYWVNKFLSLPHQIFFSFSGIITFPKNTLEIQEAVKAVPIDNLLIETDSPYLSPVPMRGKENTPLNLTYVFDKIAELRRMNKSELNLALTKNTKTAFDI